MLLPGALKSQMFINGHIKECFKAPAPTLTIPVSVLPRSPLLGMETNCGGGGGEQNDSYSVVAYNHLHRNICDCLDPWLFSIDLSLH